MITLKQILEQRPDWADLPVVVYRRDGVYEFVNASARVYLDADHFDEETGSKFPVVVFAGN